MVLVLAALLTSTPPTRDTLRLQVDLGGLVNAAWYVPAGRVHLEAALWLSRDAVFRGAQLDFYTLALAMPMLGPWLAAPQVDDPLDRAMLVTSGVLQTIGVGLAAARLFSGPGDGVVEVGPVLRFSPIAGGRLGLSVRLTW